MQSEYQQWRSQLRHNSYGNQMLHAWCGHACVVGTVIAMVVLQDTSGQPVFPRWVAFFNVWIAISFIPTGLVGFFMTGPITWHGVIGFWIPMISYGTWFIVMFLALRSAIRKDRVLDSNATGSSAP